MKTNAEWGMGNAELSSLRNSALRTPHSSLIPMACHLKRSYNDDVNSLEQPLPCPIAASNERSANLPSNGRF